MEDRVWRLFPDPWTRWDARCDGMGWAGTVRVSLEDPATRGCGGCGDTVHTTGFIYPLPSCRYLLPFSLPCALHILPPRGHSHQPSFWLVYIGTTAGTASRVIVSTREGICVLALESLDLDTHHPPPFFLARFAAKARFFALIMQFHNLSSHG